MVRNREKVSNMKWDAHIDFICAKAASRLHFLKVMRRACPNTGVLVCSYTTVIRPVLEYACPVWHSNLAKKLTNQLESQQVRALRIIFKDKSYEEVLDFTDLQQTLEDRQESIAWKMFMSILHPNNCQTNCYLTEEIRTQSPDFEWHALTPFLSAEQNALKKSFSPVLYLILKVKHANNTFKFFSALTVTINCISTIRFTCFLFLFYI